MVDEGETTWPATKERWFFPRVWAFNSTRKPSFPPHSEHLGSLKNPETTAHIIGPCDPCRLLNSSKVFRTFVGPGSCR